MKILLQLAVGGFALLAAAAVPASDSPRIDEGEIAHRRYALDVAALTTRLETFIADELVTKNGLCENPSAGQYAMRDLDGDHKEDLLLLTTFSPPPGGNYEESDLLVVLSSKPTEVQRIVLGGRGSREARQFLFDNGRRYLFIVFSVWAASDAGCCPSLSITEQVDCERGKVRLRSFDEIKRKG
jgi:hypothetical protein